MIDIHAHILPNIDDGPQSLDESIAMAEKAAADQIKILIATPHSKGSKVELTRQLMNGAIERLQAALADRGIPIRILPGAEVYLTRSVANMIADDNVFTLNRTRYVLLEPPFDHRPQYFGQAMFELQAKGFWPVLAHPERCKAFQDDLGLLYRFVERGALAQLSAGSIVGEFGRAAQDAARAMLELGLVHVIASDAHSLEKRPPTLSSAVERASEIIGEGRAVAMVTSVPEALLENHIPVLSKPSLPKKKRSWAFWQ